MVQDGPSQFATDGGAAATADAVAVELHGEVAFGETDVGDMSRSRSGSVSMSEVIDEKAELSMEKSSIVARKSLSQFMFAGYMVVSSVGVLWS